MNKTLVEIMSTTEIGETIVLRETEINTYIRKRNGLKRIHSENIKTEKLNNPNNIY